MPMLQQREFLDYANTGLDMLDALVDDDADILAILGCMMEAVLQRMDTDNAKEIACRIAEKFCDLAEAFAEEPAC